MILQNSRTIPGQKALFSNSRTKGTFFKFQEFSRTEAKFKDFSRYVCANPAHYIDNSFCTVVHAASESSVVVFWLFVFAFA